MKDESIERVVCDATFSAILYKNGDLSFLYLKRKGKESDGDVQELMFEHKRHKSPTPRVILRNIEMFSSTKDFALAMKDDGKLFKFSKKLDFHNLPNKGDLVQERIIAEEIRIEGVRYISCSVHHALILNWKGEVYFVGAYFKYGPLGGKEIKKEPFLLMKAENVHRIHASGMTSYIVKEGGELLVHGFWFDGNQKKFCSVPTPIMKEREIWMINGERVKLKWHPTRHAKCFSLYFQQRIKTFLLCLMRTEKNKEKWNRIPKFVLFIIIALST